jgi:hypothetical protein
MGEQRHQLVRRSVDDTTSAPSTPVDFQLRAIRSVALLLVALSAGFAGSIGAATNPSSTADRPSTADLSGNWTLRIMNLRHETMTTLTIQFLDEPARSCISGDWKRVIVTTKQSSDERFFPATHPLSYQVIGDEMTIGRNEMCDDYLHLKGQVSRHEAHGDYTAFWLEGAKRLGYFVLERQP